MNLKKKIFCGILALSTVFGGLVGSLHAKAMVGDESGLSLKEDAEINKPDVCGRTSLMQAIKELNVERVKELLEKGASLNIPKDYAVNSSLDNQLYSNVFELLCDLEVAHNESKYDDGGLRFDPSLDFDNCNNEKGAKIKKIVGIILEHCVKNEIPLSVNTVPFAQSAHKCGTTVWKWVGEDLFEGYQRSHGSLFNVVRMPVSYLSGMTVITTWHPSF